MWACILQMQQALHLRGGEGFSLWAEKFTHRSNWGLSSELFGWESSGSCRRAQGYLLVAVMVHVSLGGPGSVWWQAKWGYLS
jgi:hypothetical protein